MHRHTVRQAEDRWVRIYEQHDRAGRYEQIRGKRGEKEERE